MSSGDGYDYLLKFLALGDTGVGKTSLLTRYVEDRFDTNFSTTVGVDFCQKKITYGQFQVQLQLWDTAGQERFRSLTSSFFRDAMGFLLVFDLTNEQSFHHISEWVSQLQTHCYSEQPEVVVVGNKVDQKNNRCVSEKAAQALCTELGYRYIETSALDKTNVNEAVGALLELVLARMDKSSDQSNFLPAAPEALAEPSPQRGGCCG